MSSTPASWLHAPEHLLLGSNEVHVWRAYLHQEIALVQACFDILQPDERYRAGRFHFQRDRDRFIVARGVLRFILSRYLDTPPDLIRFSYNQYGKPAINGGTSEVSLRFNVSHSNEVALYAIGRGREVGLDIEFVRDDFAGFEIAERFFSRPEVAALRALPSRLQTTGFFNCWTRKEAFIKALGEGLSRSLQSFAVSLTPGEAAALLSSEDNPQEVSHWSLLELAPCRGYIAALAVEGDAPILRCWQWSK